MPFYIGKGAGSRAFDHLVKPDSTRKYQRIKDILNAGLSPVADILAVNLSVTQALRIEAELIAAFGTIDSGGLMNNSVIPMGLAGKKRKGIVVPQGAVERALFGLALLKTAILELAEANRTGITNPEAASVLGLRSDYRGRQKDCVSYSLLGLLLCDGKIERSLNAHRHTARNAV